MVQTAVLHVDALQRHEVRVSNHAILTKETLNWRDSIKGLISKGTRHMIKERMTDDSCLITDDTGKVMSIPSYMIKSIY